MDGILIELLDNASVQAMARLIAQSLPSYVANLRKVVHEQIDRLGKEVSQEIVRVAEHTATIRNDRRRNDLEQGGRVMVITGTRRSEGGEEESQVLPLGLPILIVSMLSATFLHETRVLTSRESDLSPMGAVPFSSPSAVCSKVSRMVISVNAHQRK